MWKLMIVSFSYMVLSGCGEGIPEISLKEFQKIEHEARSENQRTTRQFKSDTLLIAEKSAKKTADSTAENTAEQIASVSVNKAIQDMK